jgi:hypothetical protein
MDVTPATVSSKPSSGLVSTEFWVTAPVVATSLFSSVAGLIPPPWGLIIAAVAGGIYTAARSALKIAHASGKATAVPDLPDVGAK